MSFKEEFTTPVGRLVQGSLYVGKTTNYDKEPLVYKTGDKAGQPRMDYYVAIAIPKGTETSWSQTEWGAKIASVAQRGFPNGQWQATTFAWKITDGDSTIPNKAGTVPANCEGFPGCWILKFNGGQAPSLFMLNAQNKTQPLLGKDEIHLGDYVQISGNVSDNEKQTTPGLYLNHSMVCFRYHGERIVLGVDPDSVGFGGGTMPVGASSVPLGNFVPPVSLPTAGVTPPVAAPVAPPYAQILTPPAPPAAPVSVPVAVRVMTALATATYDQYIAATWTDAQLIASGLMLP